MSASMFYCGIDVAKRKHAVVVLNEQGEVERPAFEVENMRKGLGKLVATLEALDAEVTIALEATGHYWLALYEVLAQAGFEVVVINPLQVAAYRKSGLRKVKNDRSDATWIADFLRISNLSPSARNTPLYLQLRDLSRFRFWIMEQTCGERSRTIGNCKRKLIIILDKVFPEYESLFSSVFVKSSRALLSEAVSAQEVAEFDLRELTELLHRTSRGRFGRAKALQIQQKASESIGVGFLADAAQVEMRCLLAQLELLEAQQLEVERAQAELMEAIPQYITTIQGIGPRTGAAILGEIGDVRRFDHPDKLVAYAGIDATVHQTGQFTGTRMRMSKRGSPETPRARTL